MYALLERPRLYRLVQRLLAPGAEAALGDRLARRLAGRPAPRRCLDVGCGPVSALARAGLRPIGVDLSLPSVSTFGPHGGVAVVATAEALPFDDDRFDLVWSVGLLHHLDDEAARRAVREMVRVTRPDGDIIVVDSVWPEPAWRQPLAWTLRRLDRGRWVRSERALAALLPGHVEWSRERFTYSRTGLEALWCVHTKREVKRGAAEARQSSEAAAWA